MVTTPEVSRFRYCNISTGPIDLPSSRRPLSDHLRSLHSRQVNEAFWRILRKLLYAFRPRATIFPRSRRLTCTVSPSISTGFESKSQIQPEIISSFASANSNHHHYHHTTSPTRLRLLHKLTFTATKQSSISFRRVPGFGHTPLYLLNHHPHDLVHAAVSSPAYSPQSTRITTTPRPTLLLILPSSHSYTSLLLSPFQPSPVLHSNSTAITGARRPLAYNPALLPLPTFNAA